MAGRTAGRYFKVRPVSFFVDKFRATLDKSFQMAGGGQQASAAKSTTAPPPEDVTGMTIYQTPYGQKQVQETDTEYFDKLLADLYRRMRARGEEDPGEIGFADSSGINF